MSPPRVTWKYRTHTPSSHHQQSSLQGPPGCASQDKEPPAAIYLQTTGLTQAGSGLRRYSLSHEEEAVVRYAPHDNTGVITVCDNFKDAACIILGIGLLLRKKGS